MVSTKEQYLFDLNGFIVVREALQSDEVERINALIDELGLDQPSSRTGQGHYASFLGRDEAFRRLIDHPRVMPYLNAWVGSSPWGEPQVRLDHVYFIFSEPGSPGQHLHLGGAPYVPACSYHVRDGVVFSALTVVSYVLNEVPLGQGGFACIPGSHKANFPCPADVSDLADTSCVVSPEVRPGDAIIFTEALTHGSFPWTAPHTRRAMFYKYSPRHMTFMLPYWPDELIAQCTPEQRLMLQPPCVSDEPDFFITADTVSTASS